MTGWNPQLTRLRQQLTQLALTPGADLAQRSAAALEALGRVLPSDAAWLAVRDPEARRHTPLATAGAAEPLRSYFQTPVADAEVDALGLNRHRPPMLASEIPVPLAELHAWADHLLPAGFRGGLAAGLFTPGGRHIGFLSLLSGDPARPGPADRIIEAAAAGVVLTRGGDTLPLPGLPDHRLLTRGSSILTTAARELADIRAHISFLAPLPGSGREPLVRVTAFDCAVPDLDHLSAAVLLSPPGTCAAWGRWTCWFSGSWSTGRRRSRPSLPHWAWTRPG